MYSQPESEQPPIQPVYNGPRLCFPFKVKSKARTSAFAREQGYGCPRVTSNSTLQGKQGKHDKKRGSGEKGKEGTAKGASEGGRKEKDPDLKRKSGTSLILRLRGLL